VTQKTNLPELFGGLALLLGLYGLIRLALWFIFTRFLTKDADERGDYCDGDCK
jgi:hypothetical protein